MNIMWNDPAVKVKLYGEVEPCTYEYIGDIEEEYWSYTVISIQLYEHSIEIEVEE
ncbi:hypothetical protein GPZ88_00785 [Streptococcus ruminicola]|uniref:Uncharacterized protein n=1 Tax=Streptococcus ruminicola TaxID=2686210 RepID=A0A6G8HXV7_9STRE|nr:hypothetical protein [Streptococcus ruminicola]QIM45676.1 hypothetical protein GPZ88_00785 [Streptococcus ruminicola]